MVLIVSTIRCTMDVQSVLKKFTTVDRAPHYQGGTLFDDLEKHTDPLTPLIPLWPLQFPLLSLLGTRLRGITTVHTVCRSASFIMCYYVTHRMDVGDAIILSEPEISAEPNQLVAALMLKLPTVLVSLNVNDWLSREIYLKEKPLSGCRWNLFCSVESFPALLDPQWPGLYSLPRGFVLLLCFFSRLRWSLFSPP